MALTQQRAELTALIIEIEEMLKQGEIFPYRLTDILTEFREDRFANCLAVSPDLRGWIDRLLARIARAHLDD